MNLFSVQVSIFHFQVYNFSNFHISNFSSFYILQVLMQSSASPSNNKAQFQVLYKSNFANRNKNTFSSSLTLACQESGQRSPIVSLTKFLKTLISGIYTNASDHRQQLTVDVLDWKEFVRGVNDFDAEISHRLPALIEEAKQCM